MSGLELRGGTAIQRAEARSLGWSLVEAAGDRLPIGVAEVRAAVSALSGEGVRARVLIATEPDAVDAEGDTWSPGAAAVVCRPAFDPVVAARLRGIAAAASAVTIDVTAPTAALRGRVRDAIGWARVAVGAQDGEGGDIVVSSVRRTRLAVHALLGIGGVPVVLGASAGAIDLLRVETLGADRAEVAVVGADSRAEVRIAGADGVRTLPPVWETRERRALQRAATALAEGGLASEGNAWRRDEAVCSAVLGPVVATVTPASSS